MPSFPLRLASALAAWAALSLSITPVDLVVRPLAAQDQRVETPASRQLVRWLETFNAGDRATWQRFLAGHFPTRPTQTVNQDLGFREQTGGFDLVRFEEATPTRAVALLKIFPQTGYVVAVLANVDPPAAQRISEFVALRVPGLPTP